MNIMASFWLILAVVLGIIESATPSLVCIWPAISALTVSVCAAFGLPPVWQAGLFVVLSAVLLILTRPLSKRILARKVTATNADRIIGAEGIVIQALDPVENKGQIKAMGQVWSAKAKDGVTIPEGTAVRVTALEGVKVIVEFK